MGDKDQLFAVADRQQGFFTAKQAETCGYTRSNFHLKISSKEWVKEGRGIYRLGHYPITDRPELVLWSLWSRNRQDQSQGAWSHETALDIHALSNVMPTKMHMSVPHNFRRRKELPKILSLHRDNLETSDIEERQGYKVTTPLKTLLDCVQVGTIADNFLSQAIQQSLKRGLILEDELKTIEKSNPDTFHKIMRLIKP